MSSTDGEALGADIGTSATKDAVDATSRPLAGLRAIEMGSIGPVPHAAMMLADLGADVIRIEGPVRSSIPVGRPGARDIVLRGRSTRVLDVKSAEGHAALMDLIATADLFLEGMRPGAAERLGIGPTTCLERNPGLVYGRVTGWGQEGPLATSAGHDINYIALNGALHAMGRTGEPPAPPLNLVGDYGGGSMLLLVGLLAALWERTRSGAGQVVDTAMVDGIAVLSQVVLAMRGMGAWQDARGANLIDGGAPFYDTYACSDGRYVAVGALEPQFYLLLLAGLGIDPESMRPQYDQEGWPAMRSAFSQAFASRTRDEWSSVFEGTDACVSPVLSFSEAAEHPHLKARGTFVVRDGVLQARSAPRFSRGSRAVTTEPPA